MEPGEKKDLCLYIGVCVCVLAGRSDGGGATEGQEWGEYDFSVWYTSMRLSKTRTPGARETAQQVRALVALPENQGLIPSYMVAHNASGPGDTTPSWLPQ